MTAAWLFTSAAIIAGLGILFAFKRLLRGLSYRMERKEFNQQGLQKDQTRYFIQVALFEAIPIFLLVLGFMFMKDNEASLVSLSIPLIVILGIILICISQIWSSKQEVLSHPDIGKSEKSYINTIVLIGFSTILCIPVISIVGIILLIN
ncbi:hypothetical protein [Gracilibacillus dipsosauri]|uniref:hypothetical protein n=1 Tax=Gracilibacillus dipsosauri TaxID=178340 RepID=UPI00240A9609